MESLKKFSLLIIPLGFLLLILPGSGRYSFKITRSMLTNQVLEENPTISVDEVAAMLVNEDSTFQLIDLRSPAAFNAYSIPGAINIPLKSFFSSRPETWMYDPSVTYIFYGNRDYDAATVLTLAKGLGYENCRIMKGGLTEWFSKVMYSKFTGDRITPAQNALFEKRYRARKFFTEFNSMPDSLKQAYILQRRETERSLDGGCE